MGLALHDPSDPLPGLAESRYLGPGREPPSQATKARRSRISRAKHLSWCLRQDVYRDQLFSPSHSKQALRPYQLAILNATTHRKTPRNIRARPARRSRPALPTVHEQKDDWTVTPARTGSLAATRRTRTPSLERQDAFADARTANKRHQRWATARNEDRLAPEVEEAYRLGLLYDDEQSRGSGFELNAIVHDEPVYSIRPSGRRRKGRTMTSDAASETYEKIDLPLDLSFAALTEDAALARYLYASTMSEDHGDEMLVDTTYDEPPITRIIYELLGSSDPPPLMSPCDNMDKINTDTEDTTPGVLEYPDMISDDDYDNGDNDWDVIRDDGNFDDDNESDIDHAPFGGGGGGGDGGGGGGNAADGDNLDAWIVLG